MRFRLAALTLLALSCAETPTGSISVVTGEETDAFSKSPAPTSILVEAIAQDRSRRQLSRADLPADTIDLGDHPRADVGAIAVTAFDPGGKALLKGETLYVQWGALERGGLEVFVQRIGELARMPRGPDALEPAAATMVVGRYVFAASGTTTLLYDLLNLRPLTNQPALPRSAKSIATVELNAVVIDENGADVFDLAGGTKVDLATPAGGSYAEIAGGQTFAAPDGTQYVVGATRLSGGPSARVLVIDKEANATFASLSSAREGACAAYVEGRGLIVIGGDPNAPGAEVLAPGSNQAAPLPFVPDATRGCGATTLDVGHVAVFGGAGTETARVLDLACTTNCSGAPWPGALPLVRAQAFALAVDAAFVVGDDASGATHAFRASAAALSEIPLKTPRRGARLVASPTNTAIIVGGGNGLEQYVE